MKSAVIAAVVAAVVAAASSTAATIIVTSKNIKNGTIQTVDISAKAKAALKGNRGPRGLTGAPGAQGLRGLPGAQGSPGTAGPAGSSSLYFVRTSDIPIAPGTVVTAAAQCPEGQYPVGGGANTSSEEQYVNDSFPARSAASGLMDLWVASVRNLNDAQGASFRVYAVCAPVGAVNGNY
jgi:Collagen triple helix repeat (20 copies)